MKPDERQKKFVAEVRNCDALIYRVCRLYGCRQSDTIEDLYQEIVCALWESYDNYNGRSSSFSTWAYAVARNTAIAYYRRYQLRQPELTLCDVEADFQHLADTPDPLVAELYHLLNYLSADDREFVGLYLDGYSYEDIGNILHLSQPAVRTRMSRLKNRLRAIKESQTRKE